MFLRQYIPGPHNPFPNIFVWFIGKVEGMGYLETFRAEGKLYMIVTDTFATSYLMHTSNRVVSPDRIPNSSP